MMHGTLEMNHTKFGEWTAENIAQIDGFNTYQCSVTYYDMAGYVCKGDFEIRGIHNGNGALTLVAAIMHKAATECKRVTYAN